MTPDALRTLASRWCDADPDPATSDAVDAAVAADDMDALQRMFGHRLQFGTAGIRGPLGPGTTAMNRALVRQVSAGLGRYLVTRGNGAELHGVIVGYDGRRLSREFAEDTACVLAGLGVPVYLYDQVAPTPVLAFGVLALGCVAGVMVTASHNPPGDNGYKVYWGNGAQIVPPHDAGISAAIDAVGGPWAVQVPSLDEARADGLVQQVPEAVLERYVERVLRLRVHKETGVRAVYTAMHGVGYDTLAHVLTAAGHQAVIAVPQQRDPDGDFPTVSFPNPEEPGALDLAMALADAESADLIIAHDPDADRLAVAVPHQGGWRQLTGNEVGVLLADDLLTHGAQDADRLVATTIVSSSLLRTLAEHHGAEYAETLTGFKWIANAAIDHDGPFVMGFEEALGYSCGDVVRDKDGVSAALLILDLASWCQSRGTTLSAHLEDLYRRHGYVGSSQRSFKLVGAPGQARIAEIMAALRATPPDALGGSKVVRVQDVLAGTDLDRVTNTPRPLGLPKSNVLAWTLDDQTRVLARPSGTEPKLKFYFEVREQLGDQGLAAARERAEARMAALADELVGLAGL